MSEPLEKIKKNIENLSVEERNLLFQSLLEDQDLLEHLSKKLYICYKTRVEDKELRFFAKIKEVKRLDETAALGPKSKLAGIVDLQNNDTSEKIEAEINETIMSLLRKNELVM